MLIAQKGQEDKLDIKKYTKRDIAMRLGYKMGISTRKSLVYTNELFNVMREVLCEDKPYIRIEIRNFGKPPLESDFFLSMKNSKNTLEVHLAV